MLTEARTQELREVLRLQLLQTKGANRPVGRFLDLAERYAKIDDRSFTKAEERRVLDQYWSDLHRSGVIDAAGESFWLTDWGREVLAGAVPSPHDRQGYMAAIRSAGADPIALAYAEEAVAAWHAHLDRAAVVMTGVACERLVILLAEAIAGRAFPPYDERLAGLLRQWTPIATVYERAREALVAARNVLAPEVRDGLDRRLSAVFEHVRTLRNEQGHPTGAGIEHSVAHAALILFPTFCRDIVAVIAEIERVLPAATTT